VLDDFLVLVSKFPSLDCIVRLFVFVSLMARVKQTARLIEANEGGGDAEAG